jgi:hypothetical protein
MRFIVILILLGVILYRITNGFKFGLIEITSFEYSTENKHYVVEFERNGSVEKGYIVAKEPPAWQESKFAIAGYDVSKEMWHIIEIKKV